MSQPPLAVVPAGAGSVSPGSSPPVRVLVVDDETLTARTLVRMVRHFGHEAVVAQTIEQAITSFDQTTFDVVLTDLNLGAWSGFDLKRSAGCGYLTIFSSLTVLSRYRIRQRNHSIITTPRRAAQRKQTGPRV